MTDLLVKLLDGLKLFEVVLMIAGLILLAAIIVWVTILIKKNKPYLRLLYSSIIPCIMIGWSSISSIKYKDFILELTKQTDETIKNPTQENFEKLDSLDKVADKFSINRPKNKLLLAKTHILLAKTAQVDESLFDQSPNSDFKEMQMVKDGFDDAKRVEKINSIIDRSDIDTAQLSFIKDELSKLEASGLPIKSKKETISKANQWVLKNDSVKQRSDRVVIRPPVRNPRLRPGNH